MNRHELRLKRLLGSHGIPDGARYESGVIVYQDCDPAGRFWAVWLQTFPWKLCKLTGSRVKIPQLVHEKAFDPPLAAGAMQRYVERYLAEYGEEGTDYYSMLPAGATDHKEYVLHVIYTEKQAAEYWEEHPERKPAVMGCQHE